MLYRVRVSMMFRTQEDKLSIPKVHPRDWYNVYLQSEQYDVKLL